MPFIYDTALDALLSSVSSNTTHLYICSQEPTTYAEASSTYKLGTKASPSIGAAANHSPNGREVSVASFTDGTVDGTGTATHVALTSGAALLATVALSSSQAVTSGNTFSLNAWLIYVPDAT